MLVGTSQVKIFICWKIPWKHSKNLLFINRWTSVTDKGVCIKGKFPFLKARIIEILQMFNWSKCNKHANDKWNWFDKRPRSCLETFLSLALRCLRMSSQVDIEMFLEAVLEFQTLESCKWTRMPKSNSVKRYLSIFLLFKYLWPKGIWPKIFMR